MIDPFDDDSLSRAAEIANDEKLSLEEALTALSEELGVPVAEVSDRLAQVVRRRVLFEKLMRSADWLQARQ